MHSGGRSHLKVSRSAFDHLKKSDIHQRESDFARSSWVSKPMREERR